MHFKGTAHRYGRDIDTDVIIPARYLNSSDPEWLAAHCLEDLDKDFVKKVHKGDIIVAEENFGCGSSTPAWPSWNAPSRWTPSSRAMWWTWTPMPA